MTAEDFFKRVACVQALFPPGFNAVAECLKHGVKKVVVDAGGIFKATASYDPESATIRLNRNLDRELVARETGRRNGIRPLAVQIMILEVGQSSSPRMGDISLRVIQILLVLAMLMFGW